MRTILTAATLQTGTQPIGWVTSGQRARLAARYKQGRPCKQRTSSLLLTVYGVYTSKRLKDAGATVHGNILGPLLERACAGDGCGGSGCRFALSTTRKQRQVPLSADGLQQKRGAGSV